MRTPAARLLLVATLLAALGACALREGGPAPRAMLEGDVVAPPLGWDAFCASLPDQCAPPVQPEAALPGGAEAIARLEAVNRAVNEAITPMRDIVSTGAFDRWSLPLTVDDAVLGDCEDYAIEKRRRLIETGWPPEALRLAVATSRASGVHAALVAMTEEGDFVLDNLVDEVRPWAQTDYVWLKRQAGADPREWRRVRYQ